MYIFIICIDPKIDFLGVTPSQKVSHPVAPAKIGESCNEYNSKRTWNWPMVTM